MNSQASGIPGLPLKLDHIEVSLGRGRQRRVVVRDLSLLVSPGDFTIIIGPNGAGKTTLLRAMAGLLPSRGRIEIGDRTLATMSRSERGRSLSYLAQGGRIHWPLSVHDVVALGRLPHSGARALSAADHLIVARAIAYCRIEHLAARPATALSGGEKSRVLLARALAVQAPVLLADEPAASLDPAHQVVVMNVLRDQALAGQTAVAVLHDLSLAARYATRIVVLNDGRVAAEGRPDDIFAGSTLDRVFGIRLLRARVEGKLLVAPAQPEDGPAVSNLST
jgi:iron complex transport system ATP-binding protein